MTLPTEFNGACRMRVRGQDTYRRRVRVHRVMVSVRVRAEAVNGFHARLKEIGRIHYLGL